MLGTYVGFSGHVIHSRQGGPAPFPPNRRISMLCITCSGAACGFPGASQRVYDITTIIVEHSRSDHDCLGSGTNLPFDWFRPDKDSLRARLSTLALPLHDLQGPRLSRCQCSPLSLERLLVFGRERHLWGKLHLIGAAKTSFFGDFAAGVDHWIFHLTLPCEMHSNSLESFM